MWHIQDVTRFGDILGRAQPKAISVVGGWSTLYADKVKVQGVFGLGLRNLGRNLVAVFHFLKGDYEKGARLLL